MILVAYGYLPVQPPHLCYCRCLPQGRRTKADKVRFRHQLLHVNQLYLGTKVLILLDVSFLSRFWPQFEAWLSYQTVSVRRGLSSNLRPPKP